jgi:ABC-type antimicrobial peptide transport system permease subunit
MLRASPGAALAGAAQSVIANLEPEARIEVATMANVRWSALADERFRTSVLLAFAGTALFLALVGIFGVVAYSALQRTREIGLRVALGATRKNVIALLLSETILPAALGLAIGLAGAWVASGWLSSYLFGIGPRDPATFAGAFLVLALAALAAALLPAWRVSATNPVVALRHQ